MRTYERTFDSDSRVTYIPKEPGIYLINVRFANEHVPGSPFCVQALDNTSNFDKDEVEKMEKLEQEVGQEELGIAFAGRVVK